MKARDHQRDRGPARRARAAPRFAAVVKAVDPKLNATDAKAFAGRCG
jgi:hypothetical protein